MMPSSLYRQMLRLMVCALLGTILITGTVFAAGYIGPARPAVGTTILRHDDLGVLELVTSGDSSPLAETLVLLAGLGRSVSDFNELVVRLNDLGYRTVAVQARGVGWSFGALNSLDDYADDVARALQAAGVPEDQPVHIIGHSFGNRVARVFSTRFPEKVKSVILLAAGSKTCLPVSLQWDLFNILNPFRTDIVRKRFVEDFMFDEGNEAPRYWVDGWYTDAAWRQVNAAGSDHDGWEAGGNAPMLILEGEHDCVAPPYVIPGGEEYRITTQVIGRAAHALLPEQFEQICSYIVPFLAAQK